jgi:hypothetical protein
MFADAVPAAFVSKRAACSRRLAEPGCQGTATSKRRFAQQSGTRA